MSQFQLITDLLQNIYGRISQLGQSINDLKNSLENLNKTVSSKITSLVDTIKSMSDGVDKEGQEVQLIFKDIGDNSIREIKKLQEKIGLKDLDELMAKLDKIAQSSEEALKPETVDVLLHEVLNSVKSIMGAEQKDECIDGEDILDRVGASLSQKPESGEETTEKNEPTEQEKPVSPPPANNPPPGSPPPGNAPPGNPPPGNPPPA